jgi:hypothetical protein
LSAGRLEALVSEYPGLDQRERRLLGVFFGPDLDGSGGAVPSGDALYGTIIALAMKRLEARGKDILLLHDIHPATVVFH